MWLGMIAFFFGGGRKLQGQGSFFGSKSYIQVNFICLGFREVCGSGFASYLRMRALDL